MNEELILAIFQIGIGAIVGGIILVMMVYDLWMEYERMKQNWRK